MKYLSFLLIIILACQFVFCFEVAATHNNYCGICPDAGMGANKLCEVSDGTRDGMCDFITVSSGNGVVNLAAACDDSKALGCKDIDTSYCFRTQHLTCTTADNVYAYKEIDNNGITGDIYIQAYIKIMVAPTEDDCITVLKAGHDIEIFGVTSSPMTPSYAGNVYLGIHNHRGTLTLSTFFYTDVNHYIPGKSAITTNGSDWIGVRLHIHNDATKEKDFVEWWADWDNNGKFDYVGSSKSINPNLTFLQAFQNFYVGQNDIHKKFDFQLTGIKIDTTSMPTGCMR
jgi:hypothetical protein